jgi:hypothetical protein
MFVPEATCILVGGLFALDEENALESVYVASPPRVRLARAAAAAARS